MSIELHGAEGWDFQYEVTVWFFLVHEAALRALIVEPEGGEDAQAVVERDGDLWTIEIQAKSEQTDVDLRFLCDILFHYPSGKCSGCLLERLCSDEQRIALIVCGGRCTDAARRFPARIENVAVPADSTHVAQEYISDFKDVLNATDGWEEGTSELKQNRRKARQALHLRDHEIYKLSRRIYVLERIERDEVLLKAVGTWKQHGITASVAPSVFRELVDHVRKVRAKRGDALPGLRDIVARHRAIRAFSDPVHVPRMEEPKLLTHLRAKRVLLLTGDAQCGKSHLGRLLCQQLQDEGFAFRRDSDVEKGMRFLQAPLDEDRVFLLEDPFDEAANARAAGTVERRLAQLVRELPPHRLLVVTSRNESLRRSLHRSQPVPIDGHPWIDVTLQDSIVALEIWRRHTQQVNVPEAAARAIEQHIAKLEPSYLLQPGQLRHLAHNLPLGELTAEVIERDARFNSFTVALEMDETGPESTRALVALALTATPIRRVTVEDLTFILSDRDEQPGVLPPHLIRKFIFGTPKEPDFAPSFPRYSAPLEPSSAFLDTLDVLDRRGWIRREGDFLWFSHPDYWQAANQLPRELSPSERQWMLAITRRSISGLGSSAALGAVHSLERLASFLHEVSEQRELKQIAILALNSIFPATRDAAVRFLLPRLEQLGIEEQDEVWRRLESADDDGRSVAWHRGEPYFHLHDGTMPIYYGLKALSEEPPMVGDILTAEDAWAILCGNPGVEDLQQCLQFDEVFLRARAVSRLLPKLTLDRQPIFEQVLDSHPAEMIVTVLKGTVRAWPVLAPEVRTYVQSRIARAISIPVAAGAAADWMWTFDRQVKDLPKEGCTELWRLWGDLFLVLLNAMPNVKAASYEHRMQPPGSSAVPSLLRNAKPYVANDILIQIVDGWLRLVLRQLERDLPSGKGISVAKYLLAFSAPGSGERIRALSKLFEHPETGFVLVSLRAYVDAWEQLDAEEKSYIRDLLRGSRPDVEWLRAVALTTASVPQELVECILGQAEALQLPAERLMALLPPSLLERCIMVHLGDPQPLSWLDLNFDAHEGIWEEMFHHLRQVPSHRWFPAVWRSSLKLEATERLREWRELCNRATADEREALFGLLADCTADVNVSFKEDWTALWVVASDEQRQAWAQQLAARIERLCVYGDIGEQFPSEMIELLMAHLPGDDIARILLANYRMGLFKDNDELFLESLGALYQREDMLPRLRAVHHNVLQCLEELSAPDALRRQVEEARQQSSKRGYAERRDEPSIESPDWIYAFKIAVGEDEGT